MKRSPKGIPEAIDPKDSIVFFDFDNTITPFDILDDLFLKFSRDDHWLELEAQWVKGAIGSRECLKGQVGGLCLDRPGLRRYLSAVRVDPHFKPILSFLKRKKIPAAIVSDNFAPILRFILKKNGIHDLSVFANSVRIAGDRLLPRFPRTNRACGICAHCKRTTLMRQKGKRAFSIYIGDGRSDICPAEASGLVYAKATLRRHFEKKQRACIPFETLKTVFDDLRRRIA